MYAGKWLGVRVSPSMFAAKAAIIAARRASDQHFLRILAIGKWN
jgi:hypothetical protein